MERTWIVVASHSQAHVFCRLGNRAEVEEVFAVGNPSGRAKNAELVSGPPGRSTDNRMRGRHSYSNEETPKEHVVLVFYRELMARLDLAYSQHQYTRLELVAEPHLLGILRGLLSEQLRRIVTHEIHKDIAHERADEIAARLQQEEKKNRRP